MGMLVVACLAAALFVLVALPGRRETAHLTEAPTKGRPLEETSQPITPAPTQAARAEKPTPGTIAAYQKTCSTVFSSLTTGSNGVQPDSTVALPFGSFSAEGGVICMKGRQLYRTESADTHTFWNVWGEVILLGGPTLEELVMDHITDQGDVSDLHHSIRRNSHRVEMHPSLLLLGTPTYHFFHAWFDVALVGAVFMQHFDNGSLLSKPRQGVSLYVDDSPTSKGIEPATVLAMQAGLVDDVRYVANDSQTDEGSTAILHCYCRALLLGMTKTTFTHLSVAKIRQQGTAALTAKLYMQHKLPPHGNTLMNISDWTAIARQFWFPELSGGRPTESSDLVAPRMLWILRRRRRVGQVSRHVAAARRIGFRVLVFVPEDHDLLTQLHVSRYADIITGMHGQGLTWMIALDGVGIPWCRSMVELRHYGRQLPFFNDMFPPMARDLMLRYDAINPYFATFDANLPAGQLAWQLETEAFPYYLKGFTDQTAFYYSKETLRVFTLHFKNLERCLGRSEK